MRTLTIFAALALAGGAVTGSSVANASSHPAARTTSHHSVLTMTAHPRGGGQADIAPSGLSLGDEFFEHGTLSGVSRGSYSLSGELIQLPGRSAPPKESQHFTLRLKGGTIEAIGQHAAVDSFTVAVVGGTGHWSHASGTLHVTNGRMRLSVTR